MSQTSMDAKSMAFDELGKAVYSGLNQAENLYIDNADDFAEFWSQANSNLSPSPKSPQIDFSTHVVLAACMGEQSSGGYQIEIADTKVEGETVYASVVKTLPGKTCMSTMAITHPYHVIQLEKGSIKKAVFSEEERVDECK